MTIAISIVHFCGKGILEAPSAGSLDDSRQFDVVPRGSLCRWHRTEQYAYGSFEEPIINNLRY